MILPVCASLARRRNRISARRIDLRGTSARDHPHVGVSPDDRNFVERRHFERQLIVFIPEQNDALLGSLTSHLETTFHVDHAFLRRIIHHSAGKHGAQNPSHMVV